MNETNHRNTAMIEIHSSKGNDMTNEKKKLTWKDHCDHKRDVCKSRIATWTEKLAKWERLSKFDNEKDAQKIIAYERAKERVTRLEKDVEFFKDA